MALGYYFHPESMSSEQYDRVIEKLEQAGASSPSGRSYHCAFQVGNGIHVFDVWESEEQFNSFGQTLMPILTAEGIDAGQPDVSPIHNVIVGR
jgi:hypothetical protein